MGLRSGDHVTHKQFGFGSVIADTNETVVVRFDHGIEEITCDELKQVLSPEQSLKSNRWHAPQEVVLRVLAETILSVNNLWGVFSLSRIELLPHQLWVCRCVTMNWPTKWLVADDVGLGKTIEGGLILSSLISRGVVKRALIICPASLVDQWQMRLRTMFDIRFVDYLSQIDQPKKDFWNTHKFVIASLQTLRVDHQGRHDRLLESDPWDLILVDEAHHLNADEKMGPTLGYKLLDRLVSERKVTSIVFFSGTPHRGKNFGFLSLLHLLDERFDPQKELRRQLQYLPEVMIRNNKQNTTDLQGNRLFYPPEVASETYIYSEDESNFYNKLTDFILDGKAYASSLSGTEGQLVILVLITMQKLASSSVAAIRRAIRGRLSRISEGQKQLIEFKQKLTEFQEMQDAEDMDAISSLEEKIAELSITVRLMENEEIELKQLLAAAEEVQQDTKLNEIIRLIDDRYSNRSILFFTEYKATQSQLISYLMREFGQESVTFINGDNRADEIQLPSGEMISISEKRENAAEKFNSGKVRFLVSTEAGGEGIDLQENCYTLIHVDLPWNPMRLHQRVGRLNRYGQKKKVEVLTLRNPSTVESIIWEKLNNKIEDIKVALNQVMDEPEDLLQLVLGMTSQSLFNEIFADAEGVSRERLSDWFDQKTVQFGGRDVLETIRNLVGNASRFDFHEVSDSFPQVDLPDLSPFFISMIQMNNRRVRDSDGEISFKTPENWLTEVAVRANYENMVFDRNVHGKNATQRILGIGQKVVQKALEQAMLFEVSICTISRAILRKPLLIYKVFDRVTRSSSTLRSTIIGLEVEDTQNGIEFHQMMDWQLLLHLNECLSDRRFKKNDDSPSPENIDVVKQVFSDANKFLNKKIAILELPFQVPDYEILAILWPTEII